MLSHESHHTHAWSSARSRMHYELAANLQSLKLIEYSHCSLAGLHLADRQTRMVIKVLDTFRRRDSLDIHNIALLYCQTFLLYTLAPCAFLCCAVASHRYSSLGKCALLTLC